jgi:hypothetical protein
MPGPHRTARPSAAPSPWRLPLLSPAAVGVAAALVAGAYGAGRLVADTGAGGAGGAQQAAAEQRQERYDGPLDDVRITDATASCQSDTSRDAAGNPTAYEPANAHDQDLSTAWRCDGSGVGQRFTVQVPAGTVVGEVGLVPGYAKTDPATGVDRYAENNRITRVRWVFDDGSTFVQKMSGSADDRSLRTRRVPATETGQVVVEILASEAGPRDTVAISEIRVAAVDT